MSLQSLIDQGFAVHPTTKTADIKIDHDVGGFYFNPIKEITMTEFTTKKPITQEELTRILDSHEAWLEGEETGEETGKRADLSGFDLVDCDFDGRNLARIKFHGADLRRANFTDTVLEDADLSYADCRVAHFERTQMSGADLRRANCENAVFPFADMSETALYGTNFDCANLHGSDLTYAEIDRATNFSDTNFSEASLFSLMRHTCDDDTEQQY